MTISFDAPAVNYEGLGLGISQKMEAPTGEGAKHWSRDFPAPPDGAFGRPAKSPGSLLTRVIEQEIIPRLLSAHSGALAGRHPAIARTVEPVEAFAQFVLAHDVAEIVDRIEAISGHGIKRERIFLDLLAPLARKFGKFWEQDICTYTDIALGLSRLHQVLHEIGRRDADGLGQGGGKSRAYFAPMPGETGTFMVSLLEEYFDHAGWETTLDHTASAKAILRAAATQHFDVIGFSVGCKELIDPLSGLVGEILKVSRNSNLSILVGGGLFIDDSDLKSFIDSSPAGKRIHLIADAENLASRLYNSNEIEKYD